MAMLLSDAIEAGCKKIGPAKRAWWFDRDGYMVLTDGAGTPATGACVLGTAVVGRAGDILKAQDLVLVKWTMKLREFFSRAWPFLDTKVPIADQWCPTKGACFPRPSEEWAWWHEIQHMHDRHHVSREDIAKHLRERGF